jgi:PAS domain S-box-containing protein
MRVGVMLPHRQRVLVQAAPNSRGLSAKSRHCGNARPITITHPVSVNRHLLLVVLSALLPLLVVAVALSTLLVREERETTERGLQQNAHILALAVDAELGRSFAALEALAGSDALRRDDLASFYARAKAVRDALGLWDNVLLLSPSAEHLLNLMRPYGTKLPPVPQPEGTLTAARTRKPYVSDVIKGRLDTEWLMYIAYPVIHDDEVRYVIGVTMNYRYWSRWIAEHTPEGTVAGISDANYAVLARSQDADRFAGQPVPAWYRQAITGAQDGFVRGAGLTNPDVVAAFARPKLASWSVNLVTSGAVLDAPMRRTAWIVSLGLAAALAVAVTLALLRARVLTSGIRTLQGALEALKDARRLGPLRSPVAEIQSAMTAAEGTAEVLARRAERLNRVQAAARLGLWEWNLKTGEVKWSEGLYRLLGAEPGSFPASVEWWQGRIVEKEDVLRRFEAITPRGGAFNEEFRIRRVDGGVIWIACIGTVDLDAEGAPARMQGVNIDITARREAEELVRQSEAKFRTISHAMPAIVWTTAPGGEVLFVNDRWCQYTGLDAEAAKRNAIAAFHAEDWARIAPQRERCRRAGEPFEGEVRYLRADGEYRWHAFRSLPVRGADGAIEQWIGCAVDVHDARAAQDALREADRRKDEFLATLAHELRNPLAPIRNAVQILNRIGRDEATAHAARQMMERQIAHMVRLIDDLLDVSRITRGRLTLRREPVELAALLEQALETSRPHITQQLTVALPSEPVHLDADPVRIAQVFSNLINNAAKYTPKSGRIGVHAVLEGDNVVIRVRDTGIGIAREDVPRLFQMFSQGRTAPDRAKGGLGIGLALARSLVELHGGTVEAHSEGAGKGSEFVVRLPVIALPKSAQPGSGSGDYKGAVRRVLVVDDVEDNAASLAALLRMDGNHVEVAGDGVEAVRLAEDYKPDLIFLDLGMPNLDGLEACQLIRRKPWGQGIVIVAVTGWGSDLDRQKTLAAGFDHHLVKPVDYAAIRGILSSPLIA